MHACHIPCFFNKSRPQLRHSDVTEIPVKGLGPDLAAEILSSLETNPSDDVACALAARFWEEILEVHRVPYLLLRVADMRMALGSSVTALLLYEELQVTLQDPVFGDWLFQTRRNIAVEVRKQLQSFKHDRSMGFNPSQRWRSTAKMDSASPYCRVMRAQMEELRTLWNKLGASEYAMDKAINLHCLETNALEGVVTLIPSVSADLVFSGFELQSKAENNIVIQSGAARDRLTAIGILQDTREAFDHALGLLKSDPVNLTTEVVCGLHHMLMRHSRVLHGDAGREDRLVYTNIGVTRQITCANVAAILRIQHVKVQFCPCDEVDHELEVFCKRYNMLLQQSDVDPFAAAAWISHVFITIHPFEDGNGRLSRILASIPLVRRGLPPLCVPASFKDAYNVTLNNIRANRDGDFTSLMKNLFNGTKTSLERLQAISATQS